MYLYHHDGDAMHHPGVTQRHYEPARLALMIISGAGLGTRTVNGTDAFAPFATPAEARSLFYAGTMGISDLLEVTTARSRPGFEPPTLGLGAQDLNRCTKLFPHTRACVHTHTCTSSY